MFGCRQGGADAGLGLEWGVNNERRRLHTGGSPGPSWLNNVPGNGGTPATPGTSLLSFSATNPPTSGVTFLHCLLALGATEVRLHGSLRG